MATFVPPPLDSHQGPDTSFVLPPLSSHQGLGAAPVAAPVAAPTVITPPAAIDYDAAAKKHGAVPTPAQRKIVPPTLEDALQHEGFLESAWNSLKGIFTAPAMALPDSAYNQETRRQLQQAQDLEKRGAPLAEKQAFAKDVLLKNIPLASTIYKGVSGNYGGAAGDVVGMALPGLVTAGARAVTPGQSAVAGGGIGAYLGSKTGVGHLPGAAVGSVAGPALRSAIVGLGEDIPLGRNVVGPRLPPEPEVLMEEGARQLPPSSIIATPPPADASFVRGVPAEYPRVPPQRRLPAGPRIIAAPPAADTSFVRGVPAEYPQVEATPEVTPPAAAPEPVAPSVPPAPVRIPEPPLPAEAPTAEVPAAPPGGRLYSKTKNPSTELTSQIHALLQELELPGSPAGKKMRVTPLIKPLYGPDAEWNQLSPEQMGKFTDFTYRNQRPPTPDDVTSGLFDPGVIASPPAAPPPPAAATPPPGGKRGGPAERILASKPSKPAQADNPAKPAHQRRHPELDRLLQRSLDRRTILAGLTRR